MIGRDKVSLMSAMIALAACNRSHTDASIDVCANGACEATVHCDLGVCGEDPFRPAPPQLAMNSRHSDVATPVLAYPGSSMSECRFDRANLPAYDSLIDDSKIPELNRSKAHIADLTRGEDRLEDQELLEHLQSVQSEFFQCLDMAACHRPVPPSAGDLQFQFEVEPSGRVTAVSVAPSASLDRPDVRACARRSVYHARFPSWDGSRMLIDYSLEISYEQAL